MSNAKKLNAQTSFQTHQLKNDRIDLTLLPDRGCYWSCLRILVRGTWVDLIEPVVGDRPPFHFGSYIMAPWSNRIVQGRFEFEGRPYQLRKNFPDETAIHGDVRTRPWTIELASEKKFEATLDSHDFADFNFPFALKFKYALELSGNRLRISLFIKNVDQKRAPVGMGFHPFFKRRLTEHDEDIMVILPAEKFYPDEKCIPKSPAVSVSGPTDLRKEKYLGNPNLDHCFTDLTRNLIRLLYTGSKVEVHYQIDPLFTHVIIYAPRNERGEPRECVAVEPASHVNDGFNLYAKDWKGTGIHVLEPGEAWGGSCELSIVESTDG